MSNGDNSPGISKLAGIMKTIAEKRKDTSLVLDFGKINNDYSLTTDTFPVKIPKGQYFVCGHLKEWETESVGGHTHGIPKHRHVIASHSHSIDAHSHTASSSSVSLTTSTNGDHTHVLKDSGGAVFSDASAESAGGHSHTIDGHSHDITVNEKSLNTNSKSLTTDYAELEGESAGGHKHKIPKGKMLSKGDRVLVAWVQNDAVVIDKIMKASKVF